MSNSIRADTKLKKERFKKKNDDAGKLSPTHSENEERILFKVIDGEDIQSLAIKEDDLKKLKTNTTTADDTRHEILVKKKNRNAYPTIEVKVAKLVPNNPIKPIDTSDNLGLRFDKYGNCVPYSILGNIEDFLQESVARGKSIELPYDTVDIDRPRADIYVKTNHITGMQALNGDCGENALNNWQNKMNERKNTQNMISKLIDRPVNALVMNKSENAHQNENVKILIDRTLPLIENGKGYRLGSEFWNQPKLIGADETGIHTTLKKSERGTLPEIEQISKPEVTFRETNFSDNNQPVVAHYPWDKSTYLNQRLKTLQPLIDEILPNKADFSQLQLVGESVHRNKNVTANNDAPSSNEIIVDNTWINQNLLRQNQSPTNNNIGGDPYYTINDDNAVDDPLSAHLDVVEAPIFGPCIVFGGQTSHWTNSDNENADIVALESRLNFETKAGKRVLATFEIINIGTTVIYFDWKKLDDPNPFGVNSKQIQRFYFDTRSNVILPGNLLKLHIVFKSNMGGIFTEKWQFVTYPSMLSGAGLVLTLRGVAIQEDRYKKIRLLIEKELFVKEAEIIAKSIVELLLSGVRTPERVSSPINAFITEEDRFIQENTQHHYDQEVVQELKNLYLELFEDQQKDNIEWNLSISDFKNEIMNQELNDQTKESILLRFNSLVSRLTLANYSPTSSKLYSICRCLLSSTIDEVVEEMTNIKASLNLPSNEDIYPAIDEVNKNYEEWKKENELFKQIELERKNRLEKEKGKDKGKKGGDKKDDKKKEEKKKPTPTPATSTLNKSRASREQLSRSASGNQDKIEERIKTPIVLTDQQMQHKKIFDEKAHICAYVMLSRMLENMEDLFEDLTSEVNITQLLSSYVQHPSRANHLNADYID